MYAYRYVVIYGEIMALEQNPEIGRLNFLFEKTDCLMDLIEKSIER